MIPLTRKLATALLTLTLATPAASVLAADERAVIELDQAAVDFVRTEMRQYVQALQEITSALADKQMDRVAESARKMGRQSMQGAPMSLMRDMPMGFRQLGMSVHQDFERIAVDAESMGDVSHTLSQLGETLGKCVGCHQGFRLQVR